MVDFIDAESIDKTTPEQVNDFLQSNLNSKLKEAFSEVEGAEFHGVYDNALGSYFSTHVVFSGKLCEEALAFGSENAVGKPMKAGWKSWLINPSEKVMSLKNGCLVNVRTSIVGIYNGKAVVTYSIRANNVSMRFMFAIDRSLDMYIVFPSTFEYWNLNENLNYTWSFPASFVIKKGVIHKFDMEETSAPLTF